MNSPLSTRFLNLRAFLALAISHSSLASSDSNDSGRSLSRLISIRSSVFFTLTHIFLGSACCSGFFLPLWRLLLGGRLFTLGRRHLRLRRQCHWSPCYVAEFL